MAAKQAGIIADRVSEFSCMHCGKVLDVSDLPSFTKIRCPECNGAQRIPAQLGSFLLLEPLGQGGMGMIYRAIDQTLGRYVALKVMKKSLGDNAEFVSSFKKEAQAAASLNHPNVVQIYSFGQEKGQPYIVMELVDGGRLDKMIEGGKQLDEAKALEVHIEVTDGLNAASQAGLVHGDIKPANILFGKNGEAKVVDFGLASFVGQQEAQSGEIWGTPYFIAPEKAKGKRADFRSDIYSLGGTLFQVLTGVPPFDGETPIDVVLARLDHPAPSVLDYRSDLQDETAAMVARMLEMEPSMRYPSYPALLVDMKEALDAVKSGGPAKGGKRKGKKKVPAGRKKKKGGSGGGMPKALLYSIIGVAAVVLIAGAVAGGLWYKKKSDEEKRRKFEAKQLAEKIEEIETITFGLEQLANLTRAQITNITPSLERIDRITAPETDTAMETVHENLDYALFALADSGTIVRRGYEISDQAGIITNMADAEAAAEAAENLRSELTRCYNWMQYACQELPKSLTEAETAQREANVRISKARQAEAARRRAELEKKREAERKKREAEQAAKLEKELLQSELDAVDAKRNDVQKYFKERDFKSALDALKEFKDTLKTRGGKSACQNVIDTYDILYSMKLLMIEGIKKSPYSLPMGSETRQVKDADVNNLIIALPQGSSMKIPWTNLDDKRLLIMANAYAGSKALSTKDRGRLMLAIALYCYEMTQFKYAEKFADKAVEVDSALQSDVDRLMPDLLSKSAGDTGEK